MSVRSGQRGAPGCCHSPDPLDHPMRQIGTVVDAVPTKLDNFFDGVHDVGPAAVPRVKD